MHGMNALDGRKLSGIDHLRQSIRDILTTRIGTRVMRREYGSDVPSLVDRPMNQGFAVDYFAAVAKALRRWEPRFRLTRVALASVDVGHVTIALEGRYLPDGREITMDGIVIE